MSELDPPTALKIPRADPSTRLAWSGFSRWRAPIWLKLTAVLFIAATWLPIAVAIEWRTDMNKKQPRIHIIQDMDNQTKYKPQDQSALYNDNRADRPRVPGTVARGELFADARYFDGYTETVAGGKVERTYLADWPDQVKQTFENPDSARKFLALGQETFNRTCAMCHGVDGQGMGPIAKKASELGATQTGWVPPSNLTDEVRRGRADGHLYNTINNGIRKMGGLGHQIEPEARWAVVAYVRTLQLAEAAPKNVLNEQELKALQ